VRAPENYMRFVVVGLALTLAVGVVFQVYLIAEPGRIAMVEAADG